MKMKIFKKFGAAFILSMLFSGIFAGAASVTGTVTNKTTGKPSAGDTVVLVDVQSGMAEAARGTTDARGHYSLDSAVAGPALIRVDHQGGSYFIAAPQGGGSGDIAVYNVAAKVDGIGIDADMILVEAASNMIRVQERYLVRNTSLPPTAQFSANTFEFVLPADAVLDSAAATRPGGLATNTRPVPLSQKSHYTINVPIQPNQGEKETMFEVQYHMAYNGKYTFTPQPQMAADNLVVYLPKGMNFGKASGAEFQVAQEDPRVQTFVAKGLRPGQVVAFTVSGEGQMPREAQGGTMGQDASSGRPGGGLGVPINTPDPLSSYKWWILGALAVLFAGTAIFLLRKQQGQATPVLNEKAGPHIPVAVPSVDARSAHKPRASFGQNGALDFIKEELFAIESEKIAGDLSEEEYEKVRHALEIILKRVLKNY
jgi:hypothetical protein